NWHWLLRSVLRGKSDRRTADHRGTPQRRSAGPCLRRGHAHPPKDTHSQHDERERFLAHAWHPPDIQCRGSWGRWIGSSRHDSWRTAATHPGSCRAQAGGSITEALPGGKSRLTAVRANAQITSEGYKLQRPRAN